MADPSELSHQYINCHNEGDLDGLLALVANEIDLKRAGGEPLSGASAVRRQYEEDWREHHHAVVTPGRLLEFGRSVAVEIHVESGPPSNVMYDGVVVHEWNEADRLVRYRLYVDEVLPSNGVPG